MDKFDENAKAIAAWEARNSEANSEAKLREDSLESAERRDLITRLRSSLSTYAAQAHSYSGYHVGGKTSFLTCQVATCIRARDLIAAAVTAVENWEQPSTSSFAEGAQLSNRGMSVRDQTESSESEIITQLREEIDSLKEERGALQCELQEQREKAIQVAAHVENQNDLNDGGYFEAGFIAAKTKIIDALIEARELENTEQGEQ